MDKAKVLLAMLAIAFALAALFLFQDLRSERERVRLLQERVAGLQNAVATFEARQTQAGANGDGVAAPAQKTPAPSDARQPESVRLAS